MSLEQFLEELRAPQGAPGGGAASAMAGAMGCALFQMVAGVTASLPRFAENKDKLEQIHSRSENLYFSLLALTEKDTNAYKQVESALKMPKNTSEEKTARRQAMQCAFRTATEIPLQVVAASLEAMSLVPDLLKYGNPNAITDVCVGVFLLETAVRGASVNAKINLASIKDEEFKSQCGEKLRSAENDLSKYREQLKHAMEQAGL